MAKDFGYPSGVGLVPRELKPDAVIYFISDNGAGFDMQHADKLFSTFSRLHTQNQFEGTGIGLSTVKRIIEKHSGYLWAKAAVNEGATFYFTFSS